ncbi:uncharacterized protein BX664DRAFT_278550 [Halteromyces radiatus]|uniref:uncharacterized protein n=1 Tax=Halteromyces radiatus TaxID=101107 RepID=UPI0022207B76|nr:uncharacterized protein BX664DRAFT_278550 [Halteromyces radiatus]KAI8093524.1 hypothetical protein BX664DRAFT_278550 [Halteromyces radiatus]
MDNKIQFAEVIKPERVPTTTHEVETIDLEKEGYSATTTENIESKKKKNVDLTEHLLSHEECAAKYNTLINVEKPASSQGLTTAAATAIASETGLNILSPPKKRHPILKYFDCLLNLFNLLLVFAGILNYILLAIDFQGNFQNTYLGAIYIGVALLNAFIEFYQEYKSSNMMEQFMNMLASKSTCIRDGKMVQIDASQLVVGDVVLIRMGDKVPADVFIFAGEIKVDNSSLTGESDPQERGPTNSQKNPLEAENMAYSGTLAVNGECYGIVVRTGDHTVLGQIAGLAGDEHKAPSPLSVEISNFVKIIATIAFTTAVIFFGIGLPVNSYNVSLTINFAVSVFIGWVPQGVPMTVTILLTIAAKRMANRNVLVKDLQGVETLGAITLLATDKTGTLTRNQMTLTSIWTNLTTFTTGLDAKGIKSAVGIKEIAMISALNSRAKFDRTDVPIAERQILGDATETGLTRFAAQAEDFDELVGRYPKVFEIPFNSENKYALSIHRKSHNNGDLTLYVKGAPERVLRLCTTILTDNDEPLPLTQQHEDAFQEAYQSMAGQGNRVLAFAQCLLPKESYPSDFIFDKKNCPMENLCFVGLAALEDPPKHGVREAIGKCRRAGIKVMMVTGDHPLTAEAIGRKINLMLGDTKEMVAKRTGKDVSQVQEHEYNAIVIHGDHIDTLTDAQWDAIFTKDEIIFARTSPKHKLEIVKHAQSMGHIVGVTGDGVNDAPALKKADLGIAMNISGSDVSKDAAAMVLLDDNFASVVHGIEEGRLIFTNLKKSIQYTVSHSIPEVIPCLLYIIVPLALPLSAILILVIDLGFELFMALSFAWDLPETPEGLMLQSPRKPVTLDSIERYRRRTARLRQYEQYDDEGEVIQPSWFRRVRNTTHAFLSPAFWKEKLGKSEDEILVDLPLLSWAYLEIGVIEAIGAMTTYFVVMWYNHIDPVDITTMQRGVSGPTYYFSNGPLYAQDFVTARGFTLNAEQQHRALAQAQSMVYFGIMIMQMFNLFASKTRYTLPLGRYAFSNKYSFLGIFGGASLGTLIVYCPPFNIAFGSEYHTLPLWWLIPFGFGWVIILYACLRMYIFNKIQPIRWNPTIQGLRMHPTIRTMASRRSSQNVV